MASYAEDADPRFSDKPADVEHGRRQAKSEKNKIPPRIAFTGEEFGFGYRATDTLLQRARQKKDIPDGGLPRRNAGPALGTLFGEASEEASKNSLFDYSRPISQPLRTKEQALMAVKQGTADFAVIPFYHPYSGYDYESLRALGSLFTVLGVDQIEATDKMCLAVHESQLYDIIQSSHPGTGFSALQRRMRQSWGLIDNGSGNAPDSNYDAEMPRAGLPIDMGDQKLIRDRIDLVFAGPEAARRAKSKLDGLRAIGVEVQETAELIEPQREYARRARASVNMSRQTNTMFDPVSGKTQFVSTLGAESQTGKLYGMILPYEVAMRSSDYVIVDHDVDDGPAEKSRFMVVENNPDDTLVDALVTTGIRTKRWMRRLSAVSARASDYGRIEDDNSSLAGIGLFAGSAIMVFGMALMAFGALALAGAAQTLLPAAIVGLLSNANAIIASAAGLFIAVLGLWILGSASSHGNAGVRVMLRFQRAGLAASISDVENYLRNHGVRHAVARLDEDSDAAAPASIMLDIEFEPEHLQYKIDKRLWGAVADGAMKKAFRQWKGRNVLVLAAMPFHEPQLPPHRARGWLSDAIPSWMSNVARTFVIRSFPIMLLLLMAAMAAFVYLAWRAMPGG